MPIDATIPLGIQQPQPMQSLSSVLGIAGGLQQLRGAQIANAGAQIGLDERRGLQKVLSNPSSWTDQNGDVDLAKLAPQVMSVAPTTGADAIQRVMQVQQLKTSAHQSINALNEDQRRVVANAIAAQHGQAPEVIGSTLQQLGEAYPGLKPAVDYFSLGLQHNSATQADTDNFVKRAGLMVQNTPTQQDMRTPKAVSVSNGQQSSMVSVAPGTDVAPGQPLPGTVQQQQLPPTTPVVNPDGSGGYVGAQGQGGPAVFDLSGDKLRDAGMLNSIANDPKEPPDVRAQARAALQQTMSRPASSLPPGQAANMQNNVEEMNRHFAALQDQASGAQLVQGLTGNIKALANKANAGTGGDKLQYINGLLSHIPWADHTPMTDLKTAGDMLEKNMAQLNLGTPASSDAARTLVAAARPNSHMTPEAISEAADQVASQVKANMAMRNALTGYKMMGDVQGYTAARAKLEQVADPRVWQYEALGPGTPAAKEFLGKLTDNDRASLIQKAQTLTKMGLIQ